MTCTGVGRCSYGAKRAWGVAEMDSKNVEVVIILLEVIIIFVEVIIIFVEVIIILTKVIIIFAEMVINLVEVSTA